LKIVRRDFINNYMSKSNTEYNYIRKHANNIRAINVLGGKCSNCGDTNITHLHFHHTGDEIKEYGIAQLTNRQYKSIINEVHKCILLCANCHYEFHYAEKIKKLVYFNRASVNKKTFLAAINKFECERCGYNKCYDALDFHHMNPQTKSIALGNINKRFSSIGKLTEDIIAELDQCEILCKNCHLDEHFDVEKFNKYKVDIYKKVDEYRQNNVDINGVLIKKLHNDGKSWKEISNIANVSIASISKYLNGQ
jgi:hypothetical protein